jgi:phosphoglycolate phosphatase
MRTGQQDTGNLLGTAVVFDFDGVLIDSRFAVSHCMNRALAAHGLPERPPEELYAYIGPPTSIAFAELLGEPLDSPFVADVIRSYRECYGETALDNTRVFDGIPQALARLASGHRLAVATSKPLPFAEQLLRGLGLRERFATVAGPAFDAADDKTATLAAALAALGPTRAVMIGDTTFDIAAAVAHGMPGIGVAWGIGDPADLEAAGASRIVATPQELPGAVEDEFAIALP